jgi:hypothetical protein
MALVIMIRVKISGYREELVRSYYHDNSAIGCTESRLFPRTRGIP